MASMGRLAQVTLECAEPRLLARFWQLVLRLDPPTGDDDNQTLLWEPVGRLTFHRVDGYRAPEWPGRFGEQRSHFDLLVDDLDEACIAVESAGALPLSPVLDPRNGAWRIYADPEGHPFCLVTTSE